MLRPDSVALVSAYVALKRVCEKLELHLLVVGSQRPDPDVLELGEHLPGEFDRTIFG